MVGGEIMNLNQAVSAEFNVLNVIGNIIPICYFCAEVTEIRQILKLHINDLYITMFFFAFWWRNGIYCCLIQTYTQQPLFVFRHKLSSKMNIWSLGPLVLVLASLDSEVALWWQVCQRFCDLYFLHRHYANRRHPKCDHKFRSFDFCCFSTRTLVTSYAEERIDVLKWACNSWVWSIFNMYKVYLLSIVIKWCCIVPSLLALRQSLSW
jgi:hypothetical protein